MARLSLLSRSVVAMVAAEEEDFTEVVEDFMEAGSGAVGFMAGVDFAAVGSEAAGFTVEVDSAAVADSVAELSEAAVHFAEDQGFAEEPSEAASVEAFAEMASGAASVSADAVGVGVAGDGVGA